MHKDLKYLIAYAVPASVGISFYFQGLWSFFALAFLFGLLPLMETVMPGTTQNHLPESEPSRIRIRYFDYLLYLNVPIQLGLVGWFLFILYQGGLAPYEYVGLTFAMGMACGSLGINVAHELGHRNTKSEQIMAQTLLLTSLYMHFFIEHNRGHHKHVATPLDPATSRKGEYVYAFWFRSITGGFRSAWQLEKSRLEKKGKAAVSWDNQMLRFQLIQLVTIIGIWAIVGPVALVGFLAAALIGILELETVNYLEHYGLMRKELRPGVYERVLPVHSWNSNRTMGRIMLYELTRHSDHHYLASRKYQVLRHFRESPELPGGYPAMMILALIPPIWFRVMDSRLEKFAQVAA